MSTEPNVLRVDVKEVLGTRLCVGPSLGISLRRHVLESLYTSPLNTSVDIELSGGIQVDVTFIREGILALIKIINDVEISVKIKGWAYNNTKTNLLRNIHAAAVVEGSRVSIFDLDYPPSLCWMPTGLKTRFADDVNAALDLRNKIQSVMLKYPNRNGFLAIEYARTFECSLHSASGILAKLYRSSILVRTPEDSPTGGIQYRYRISGLNSVN